MSDEPADISAIAVIFSLSIEFCTALMQLFAHCALFAITLSS